jgi:hypothetical protein
MQTPPLGSFNNIRMPTHLVNVIKQMYDGDEYVLIDGAKTTSTGNSTTSLRVKNKVVLYLLSSFPFLSMMWMMSLGVA